MQRRGVTLFVENIPSRMQWKGLWHLFARHGEVTRTYVARKLSRGGKRFAFVSFGEDSDATRPMERLNGFNVYGIKTNKVGEGANMDAAEGFVQGEKVKKVRGHVQDEDLWELQKCLVGEMATVCSVRAIVDRLEKWGLNGIKVRRMGGKTFLLSFEDEDLYIMLEDLEWSYLKEIFCKVEKWSEKRKRTQRATWIEVKGLPLHVWNDITLKRIAEIWGKFKALGENASRMLDYERVMVLISTILSQRIEETIIVEVGDEGYEVSVLELGFKDGTLDPLSQSGKVKIPVESTVSQSESSSEFSFDHKQSTHLGKKTRMDDVEMDTLIGERAGKDVGAGFEQSIENMKGLLGEKEKSVSINLISAPKIVGENEKKYGNEA
ncbi:hypothetical protein V6N13_129959 [Hibiscus sabdariffa]